MHTRLQINSWAQFYRLCLMVLWGLYAAALVVEYYVPLGIRSFFDPSLLLLVAVVGTAITRFKS